MRELLRLYLKLIGASVRSRMQYRTDFTVNLFFNAAASVVDFLLVGAILLRFRAMQGWSLWEIGLLYGLMAISAGLFRAVASELHNFDQYMVNGEFDGLLLRPWPTLLVLFSRNLDFARLGASVQGAVVLGLSAWHLYQAGALAWWEVLYLAALPIPGTAILVAIALMTGAVYFWAERAGELKIFTSYAPNAAGSFPLHIYPAWLRWVFFSVVPIAYLNFVPVRFLIEKGGTFLSLVAPVVAAVLTLGAGRWLWRLGERHYQSTGT